MALFTDQTGRTCILQNKPTRIVSLVPSQTELLYDLGLDEEVAGITKFCVHPQHWLLNKTRIGGTKSVHIKQVKALQPDLVIANKEENTKEEVEELSAICPVWTSDIQDLQQSLQMIAAIGAITGMHEKAASMITDINSRFSRLPAADPVLRTAYLIWQHPYMAAGGDTFIHDMLMRCGFENIFCHQQRYPTVTIEEIKKRGCELLLLSSEPFPFKQDHIREIQALLPATKIVLADGEMFSWYGSRLLLAPAYFTALINEIKQMPL